MKIDMLIEFFKQFIFTQKVKVATGNISTPNSACDKAALQKTAESIESILKTNDIQGIVKEIYLAPRYATYVIQAKNTDLSKLSSLRGNLALVLNSSGLRIAILNANKRLFTIEIPHVYRGETIIPLKTMMEEYKKTGLGYKIPVMLGVNNLGENEYADLTELESILMAGSTGSGKSIFNHDIIYSLIARYSPNELRFYLTDVKRVEFPMIYNGLPHLISPVDVEIESCFVGLVKVAQEKDRRIEMIIGSGSKNIEDYNLKFPDKKIPYLVNVVDTFSDLACYNLKRLERIIQNLTIDAAKAGVHLIMCDSRPSLDVYTEAIKGCFPTKIAFNTTSQIDSEVIIGQAGAEKLLGRGDMLLLKRDQQYPTHLQAPFISEEEIEKTIASLK